MFYSIAFQTLWREKLSIYPPHLRKFASFTPLYPSEFPWPSVGGGGMDIFWNHTIRATLGVKGFSWILYSSILPLLFLLCLQTVFCPLLFTIHPLLDPHIGWIILIQSMAPSIALEVWPFFAFHYDNMLNISVVTDLFFSRWGTYHGFDPFFQ